MRAALDAAIDRQTLVDVVFSGMFAPNAQPVPPNSPFYDEFLNPPPRDLAKAKALLRKAGVTPPVTLELLVPNQPDNRQAAEVIQSMAAEAGFDVHLHFLRNLPALAHRPDRQDRLHPPKRPIHPRLLPPHLQRLQLSSMASATAPSSCDPRHAAHPRHLAPPRTLSASATHSP